MNNENQNQPNKNLDDILLESEVLELLGINRGQLDRFRTQQQLPYCKLGLRSRLYLVQDIIDFIVSRRMVLNHDLDDGYHVRDSIEDDMS